MHILIAEDDERLGRLIKRVLQEEGHVVEWSTDGHEAAARLGAGAFDVVILDVMLPGVDGFTIVAGQRAAGDGVGILMLTARGTVRDRVRGLDAGADDYLVKPFAMPELLARIRALGRRPSASPGGDVLRAGPITLDTRARRVTVDGVLIELTPREHALLELFLRNPGAVLSRTQILDRVWSYDYDGGSNVVETYVRYLRQKLGKSSRTSSRPTSAICARNWGNPVGCCARCAAWATA